MRAVRVTGRERRRRPRRACGEHAGARRRRQPGAHQLPVGGEREQVARRRPGERAESSGTAPATSTRRCRRRRRSDEDARPDACRRAACRRSDQVGDVGSPAVCADRPLGAGERDDVDPVRALRTRSPSPSGDQSGVQITLRRRAPSSRRAELPARTYGDRRAVRRPVGRRGPIASEAAAAAVARDREDARRPTGRRAARSRATSEGRSCELACGEPQDAPVLGTTTSSVKTRPWPLTRVNAIERLSGE